MTDKTAVEVMARALFKHGHELHRHQAQEALDALKAEGFCVVPVEFLEQLREREYNPFEPDNQTKEYRVLQDLIAAAQGGK